MYSKLQYISQGHTAVRQIENIMQALDGGCQWVQLRFKHATEKEFALAAEQVKQICTVYKSVFIINDHVKLALQIEADGVHLGLDDMPIANAREITGFEKIIGGTANTLDDVWQRVGEGCDYIGLGPFRFTPTKEKLSPVLGLQGYKHIMNSLSEKGVSMPVYAIGGINLDDLKPLANAGIYGVAMSGTITNEKDKKKLIREINTLLR